MGNLIEVLPDEFELGQAAYYDSRDDLYFGASEEFKEGYKDAWYANNQLDDWKDPSGQYTDEAWSHHEGSIDFDQSKAFAEIEADARKKAARANTDAQIRAYGLGILTAVVLGGFILAPFLLESADVVRFWQTVGGMR